MTTLIESYGWHTTQVACDNIVGTPYINKKIQMKTTVHIVSITSPYFRLEGLEQENNLSCQWKLDIYFETFTKSTVAFSLVAKWKM
jgi:hypothetical protein